MTINTEYAEGLAEWGEPKRVTTKRGPRLLRKAKATDSFWQAWRESKDGLKSLGVSCSKNRDGEWEACWWQEDRQAEQAIEASRATDADVDLPVPDGQSLMPFQRAGVAAALRIFESGQAGALIGDEMGLGKTVQALVVANMVKAESILVICPASLRINWRREAEAWLTMGHESFVVTTGKDEIPESASLVIVNDDLAWRKGIIEQLKVREWDLMIVDEAHRMKNPEAKRTRGVLGWYDRRAKQEKPGVAASAKRLLLLTGTPIMNRPVELWPLLHAMDSATWSNFFAYAMKYCAAHKVSIGRGRTAWDFTGASNLDGLQQRLRAGGMIRRLKSEVLTELPAKRRQVLAIPPNGLQGLVDQEAAEYARHEAALSDLTAEVMLADAAGDGERYAAAVEKLRESQSAAFAEMAQIRHDLGVAKSAKVVEHLLEMLESEQKIVVFAHHKEVVRRLVDGLTDAGHRVVQLTGSTSADDRQTAVDSFQQDPNVRVFVGNIQAAGVGITLTAASTVVFAELDWVPANVTQAEDRCHRIGQSSSVLVQHIVLDGSLDATLAKAIVAKQRIADQALDDVVTDEEPGPSIVLPPRAPRKSYPKATDAEHDAALEGLRFLAARDNDFASRRNGIGFSGADTRIGHELASRGSLTDGQVWLAKKVLRKYMKTQLPEQIAAAIAG